MNILDENIPEGQRGLLGSRRIPTRQIGADLGWKGMQDEEIISLLHQLDRPTFFTLDWHFYKRRFCHGAYCIVYLAVTRATVAHYVRQVLRHPALNSKTKRMGRVMRALPTALNAWRLHQEAEEYLPW